MVPAASDLVRFLSGKRRQQWRGRRRRLGEASPPAAESTGCRPAVHGIELSPVRVSHLIALRRALAEAEAIYAAELAGAEPAIDPATPRQRGR